MLKKIAFAALGSLGALALAGGAAQANSSQNFVLRSDVPLVCGATADATTANLDLTITTPQHAGNLTYTCNAQNGFSFTLSSANAGKLVNGTKSVAWEGTQNGAHGLQMGPGQLTTSYTSNVLQDDAFLSGVVGSIDITIPQAPAHLYAGTYSDVVTLTVTAK